MRIASLALCLVVACSPSRRGNGPNGDDDGSDTCPRCSADKSAVIDCDGNATECNPDETCADGVCMNGCMAAETNHESVGCDYYAVDMDAASGPPEDACYTVFVANTSRGRAHISAEWNGQTIDLAQFAKLPTGQGMSLTYAPYDPVQGLAPSEVAILFLAYGPPSIPLMPNVTCPVPAAIGTDAQIQGPGYGHAFHITTDLPVVAYQMLPYGGGNAAATGASLLLPTSAWSTNYVAVEAYDTTAPPIQVAMGPSFNIVAMEDDTHVQLRPKSAVTAGGGLTPGPAGQSYDITLAKGQYAQFTEASPLSGSPITADKSIGVFGGNQIMSIDRCCGDHGEQMLAPARANGNEYVMAPHGDRKPAGMSDPRVFRIYGMVDGTNLTYDPPNLGPNALGLGGFIEIRTDTPFIVRSQDSDHPISVFTYMTGAGEQGEGGWGDADFVRMVPPAQYLSHYVFFTDVTYPFTVLTVVRTKKNGAFSDVNLDCLGGPVTGWQPVGDYEITYVKLVDHWMPQNGCNNGVHTMDSAAPFGVWVWGWGSEDTNTGWVSYGYPAGEGVLPINDVIIE
jgi:IgGFc binding protein